MEQALNTWFLKKKRDLPWRQNRSPYRVWLSEIMLQQTQVDTVISYYERFTQQFPAIEALAGAPEDRILALWSGLGYYTRARNLHKTAQMITEDYNSFFPDDYETLQKLPGVGSYTAGAILAFAFEKAAPVVDGNIARVFSRLLDDHTPWGDARSKKHFEAISLEFAKKANHIRDWQEGLMELGALVCKKSEPDCHLCPFETSCLAKKRGTISDLPKIIAKKPKQRFDVFCDLIYDAEHIWLEKNQSANLFKGLYMPPFAPSPLAGEGRGEGWLTTKRALTHRDLYLHGRLVPKSSLEHPSPHWIKRSEIKNIGLPTAFKALLQQAALLSLLLFSACSHKSPSIRYATNSVAVPPKLDPFEYARSLLGQSHVPNYRADCSGTVEAIYDAAGWNLGPSGKGGSEDLYAYFKKNAVLDTQRAKPGDLVFFDTGESKKLAHVGFVEEVLPDKTVLFIHHMSGLIIRSRMNLKNPSLQIDPQTQKRLNHILRRGKKKSYTAAQLFVAFGRLQ